MGNDDIVTCCFHYDRAMQESLLFPGNGDPREEFDAITGTSSDLVDQDLRIALQLSERETQDTRTSLEQEDEMLRRILQLSLVEK